MSDQLNLLEYAATRGASRKSDPQTCRDGADVMSGDHLRRQQARVLHAVTDLGSANAHEVQRWFRDHDWLIERNAVGSRFAELCERGWLRLLPGVSHRDIGKVHEATEAGRLRLDRYLATEAAA